MQNLEPSRPANPERCSRRNSFAVRFWDGIVGIRERLTPAFFKQVQVEFRTNGFRGLIQRYGWKIFAIFFCYYLIRDSILYIALPYLIAKGLF